MNQCKRLVQKAKRNQWKRVMDRARIKLHVCCDVVNGGMEDKGWTSEVGVGNGAGRAIYGRSRHSTTLSVSASTVAFCRPSPAAITTPLKCGSIGSDGGPEPGVDVGVDVAVVDSAGLKFRKGEGATSER